MKKPNIILYFVDDMGIGDVSCFNENGKIHTPNIDSLAETGIKFTDAHASAALCTPSRYSTLTGRYNWRSEKQKGICQKYEKAMIEKETWTIGTLLQQNDYNTVHIGKWHLGRHWDFDASNGDFHFGHTSNRKYVPADDAIRARWKEAFSKPITDGPIERGFDYSFGVDIPNWPPFTFIENDHLTSMPDEWLPEEFVCQKFCDSCGPMATGHKLDEILNTLTKKAEDYIEEKANEEKPFFMYFASTTPHTPLTPHKDFVGASGLNSPYADLVIETDASLGRLMKKLDECGISDDTLIIFASDNGFAQYAGFYNLLSQGHHPSAHYRGFKSDIWDGGHRTPLLMSWKNGFKVQEIDHLVCLTDLFATIADITGASFPENAGVDSFDLLPLINGGTCERDFAIHHSSLGRFAVRNAEWKLILCPTSGGTPNVSKDDEEVNWNPKNSNAEQDAKQNNMPPIQLYNMIKDVEEKHNVYKENMDVVNELLAKLEKAVEDGRTTKGTKQKNAVPVDIWKTNDVYKGDISELFDYGI